MPLSDLGRVLRREVVAFTSVLFAAALGNPDALADPLALAKADPHPVAAVPQVLAAGDPLGLAVFGPELVDGIVDLRRIEAARERLTSAAEPPTFETYEQRMIQSLSRWGSVEALPAP